MTTQITRQARDQEILRLWNEEVLTLEEIGERFDISRERVRQLLVEMNGKQPEDVRKARAAKKKLMAAADAHDLLHQARAVIEQLHAQGYTKQECLVGVNALYPGHSRDTIELALKESGIVFSKAKVAPQFGDELLKAAVYFVVGKIHDFQMDEKGIATVVPQKMISEIAEHAESNAFPSIGIDIALRYIAGAIDALEGGAKISLSHQAYEKERSNIWTLEGWFGGADQYWPPTKQTVMKRLGNSYWDDAMLALGLTPSARRGRPRGNWKYSNADYEAAIRDYLGYCTAHKLNPTFDRFEQWVKIEKSSGRVRPSSMSVRNVFGGWIGALQSEGMPGSLAE